jgi:hypothetical protein
MHCKYVAQTPLLAFYVCRQIIRYTASYTATYSTSSCTEAPPPYLRFSLPKLMNTSGLIALNRILLLAHLLILYSVFKSLQLLSAAMAAWLALQIQIALMPWLVVSHQHLNEIPDTLSAGVGEGEGTGAGVPAEAVRRRQAEVAAPKLAYAVPYRPLRNPINQLRSS